MTKINIIGTSFDTLEEQEFLNSINEAIIKKTKIIISFPNAYICLFSKRNSRFNILLNQFDLIIPDGIGVYLASKFLFAEKSFKSIIVSTDIWFKLFNGNFGYKFSFVGGEINCKSKIEDRFNKFGRFKIVYSLFKPSNSDEDLKNFNSSNSDILMVALGTPFQEEWIIKNKDKLNVPVIIAVGSGLDFLAGVKKRAPLWMRKLGLEWFYRLFQEPRRLWKRYVFGIPVFIFHILIQKVKLMLKKV